MHIRNNVFTIEKNVPKEIEVDEFDCLDGRSDHFLIRLDGENAGTLRCVDLSEDTVRLQRFCLEKRFRKRGLGKKLLEYAEKYYCEKGKKRIKMDAQLEAEGFYGKCGYQRVSDIFMEAGIQHVEMTKAIFKKGNSELTYGKDNKDGGHINSGPAERREIDDYE